MRPYFFGSPKTKYSDRSTDTFHKRPNAGLMSITYGSSYPVSGASKAKSSRVSTNPPPGIVRAIFHSYGGSMGRGGHGFHARTSSWPLTLVFPLTRSSFSGVPSPERTIS